MPRIPTFQPTRLDAAQQAVYDAILSRRHALSGQPKLTDSQDGLGGPFNAFLLQPALGMALQELGAVIRFESGLETRAREVAILAVAAHLSSSFERQVHEPIAEAAGLSKAQIHGLRSGDHRLLNPDDALVADAARRLVAKEDLADAEFAQLRATIGDVGIFELTSLAGYYRLLALQMRVFRVSGSDDEVAASSPSEDLIKRREAQRRSMTVTRMLDYGMDHWDASHLDAAPAWEPWHVVATRLADAQLARAEEAKSRQERQTAVACYRRAAAALCFAQMEFNGDTPTKIALYERMTMAYESAANLDSRLYFRRIAIPHSIATCAAWFVTERDRTPGPTVIIVGGQSGWGPAYHSLAASLVARGLNALLFEAPGQGLTRMKGGLHLDGNVHLAFSSALDVVEDLTGFKGPAGVWGNSLGGLLAARAAVHDPRFAACCVNGAPTDPRPAPFRTAIEQSQALLGVAGAEEVERAFRPLWLDPDVDTMNADLLVIHGGADPLITREQQERFLPMSQHASMRIWDDGEHTIYNHAAERTEFAADWFRSRLLS